jgi:signal transduction histidine kinase/CheY-like chemotaxis protein/HPt (histidine-containing phosphotransfer) domain-containing protein
MKKYTKLIIVTSSLVSISLIFFIAFNANSNSSRMFKNNTEVYSAYRISELMKAFKSNITLLENKQRGYIVTGDAKFLEAYKIKESETKTYLKSMEKYFVGKPEEQAFIKLKKLTYKKLSEVKNVNSMLSGVNGLTQNNGVNTMTEIKNSIDEISENLSKTTKVLLDNSIEFVNASKKWIYLEITFGFLTALIAVIILISDINTRNNLENELRIAKLKADENSLLKEQFMANMSHEIRTPMNAILGFSELLQKTQLDESQKEYLSAVRASSSNLLNIINDILDFSKIEAGELNFEKVPFSIHQVINSLSLIFEQKANEKNINFVVTLDPLIPEFVLGDPTRLSQILTNLISNAIKFTSKGSVIISCVVFKMENGGVDLEFNIKDSGIGIPEDKIYSVFDRFNQGNTDTTRVYGGTGLGLAIVKQLVEIQDGTITLNSKLGLGTEFSVKLSYPISKKEETNSIENAFNQLHIKSTAKQRVLLVEDNLLNQKLASIFLKGFGLDVDFADNGMDALKLVKQNTYELILMDVHMPILDGYATTEKIRGDLHKADVPIIAMTANVLLNERERCLQHGMTDFIAKPFKEVELFEIVHKYIANKSQGMLNENNVFRETEVVNNDYKLIDIEQLKSLSRGDNLFVAEIINIFLEQCPNELNQIKQAITVDDFKTAQSIAHKMKTSVGFIGVQKVLLQLSEFEFLLEKPANRELINEKYQIIQANCLIVTKELKQFVVSLHSNT